MKKLIEATKVAFYWSMGDNRSPEDFALPACMTSLAEALGENYGVVTIHAHGREYTKRLANDQFLAASGMAFGLLWHPERCMSAMDLSQVTDLPETVERAFRWAGYACEQTSGEDEGAREKVVRSIDAGAPLLAYGLFDPPECALVTGYDEDGAVLIGWSHFQDMAGLPTEPNGMFRLSGWEKNCWLLAIPGEKRARSLTREEALAHGLEIMDQTRIDCYLAGQAAYEAWINDLTPPEDADDAELKARFAYHHNLLFNHAEARCYGASFLEESGAKEAADCFRQIHDLCWKADAVAGGGDGWASLRDPEKRDALIGVMREIRALDLRAANALRAIVHVNE